MTNKLEDLFSYLMYHFVTHDSSYAHAVGLLCEKSVNENEDSRGVSSTTKHIQNEACTVALKKIMHAALLPSR